MIEIIAHYGQIRVRPSRAEDLDFILRTECDPKNTNFISQWSRAEHQDAMSNPTVAHWVIEADPDHRAVGYMILKGIGDPNRVIEFRRIAINEKGKGYGRNAVQLIKQVAFEQWGAHRLWLDVMVHNERAQQLYLSEGFIREGVMRESLKRGAGYVSLVLMSMLKHEYDQAQRVKR